MVQISDDFDTLEDLTEKSPGHALGLLRFYPPTSKGLPMLRKLIAVGAFCALAFAGLLATASPPVEVPMFEAVPIVSDVSDVSASLIAADAAVVAIIAIAAATIAGLVLTIARQRGGHGAATDRAGPARYRPGRTIFDPGRSMA